MIPEIGLMIAAYITTRIVAMLWQPARQVNIVTKALGVVTVILTGVVVLDLLLGRHTPMPC